MPAAAPPMPIWSVKFFRDLRSQTPTRLGYISRASEAEVEQLALERMDDEDACRVEICRVLLHPLIPNTGSIEPRLVNFAARIGGRSGRGPRLTFAVAPRQHSAWPTPA